jgi:hypothetical protein
VQSQRDHERRLAAGRNAGAVFMSEDGLHGLRPGRSRCAAGLVAAYKPAAVVMAACALLYGAHRVWPTADAARVESAVLIVFLLFFTMNRAGCFPDFYLQL